MKPKVIWDDNSSDKRGVRSVGMVMNPDASGAPYLGVVRRQDLLDGWTATSSLYAGIEELGVFENEDEAIAAVLEEAGRVFERRERSAQVAAMKKVECERIRGAGRATIDPPEIEHYRDFTNRSRARGRARGIHAIARAREATP